MSISTLSNLSLTVTRKTWTNVRGQRTASPSTVAVRGTAQPMSANRVLQHGLTTGETGWVIYLAANPVVNAGDTIAWTGHTVAVLAPARDMGGRGLAWAVDCKELA